VQLFRELGFSSSIFLVIGNIIGVGIFTTSGIIAEQLGRSVWVIGVWVLGGFLALIGACCYSLLVRKIPKAGGEYAFLYPTYGPLPAFLSGWASLLIGFSAPIAATSLGLGYYLLPFFPESAASNPMTIKWIAAVGLISVTAFISLGLQFGARLHSTVTFLNLALLVGFSALILVKAPLKQNLDPILSTGLWNVDLSSLGAAVVLVMFGYSGWNAAAYVAEEVRDPKRNIPSALLLGTSGVIVAYLLVNVAYFGGAPWIKLTGQIAVAEVAASETLGTVGSSFVTLLILSSILSSLTAMSIAGPRVYFAMSRDKLFPGWLSHVDPKRKLPIKAICFQSVIALILITVARFGEILLYAGTILILFTTLTVSVLLTYKRERRGVVSWVLYRLLPSVFVLTNIAVLVTAAYSRWQEALAGVATVAAGLPVYWYYKSRRGAEGQANEEPRDEPAQM